MPRPGDGNEYSAFCECFDVVRHLRFKRQQLPFLEIKYLAGSTGENMPGDDLNRDWTGGMMLSKVGAGPKPDQQNAKIRILDNDFCISASLPGMILGTKAFQFGC